MNEDYLDITKSVMISSPAGSGKTEKLARRYIALLRSGSEVERILSITFTDKAAAEMKERILKILSQEDAGLFEKIRGKIPRMRISTIHSFCLKLLKRFCLDLGIDPSLQVVDGFNADILWSEAIYESLLEDGRSGERLFYELIKDNGVRGWNKLYGILQELHGRRPAIELGLRDQCLTFETGLAENPGIDSVRMGQEHLEKIVSLYGKCLERYRRKKLERHVLDYNDLELMAYEAISKNPEWQNVLFSFDEHTDHILVDEFQDTSSLQWKIIDKLTEEWRSGLGSKRDAGVRPSMFLVGDDKQSIYSFRGANVSIFRGARERLFRWLEDEYRFIEARENYRSLPAIVNFVNTLFEGLMSKCPCDDLTIEYTPFEATREGEGIVELLLLEGEAGIRDSRKAEALQVARKIRQLRGTLTVHDRASERPCKYEDMAILLRGRTHLALFEDALRKEGVPFIVVKGIGFYHTPEVAILRDLLFFLIDPMDDYSLFNILRSPLFSLDYGFLFSIMRKVGGEDNPMGYLFDGLKSAAGPDESGRPAQGSLWSDDAGATNRARLGPIVTRINRWIAESREKPYSILIEDILCETGAWQYFHERQRRLNVRKFISLVEEFESQGMAGPAMREKLIRASARADEPKANVNTESMDAVRIMTIHASKGLQFPIVFLPCLDEENKAAGGSPVAMDEEDDRIVIAYEEDSEFRKVIPIFKRQKEKVREEEKRLFYVAVTRAMDHLFMSGAIRKDTPTGRLLSLSEVFSLKTGDTPYFRVRKSRIEDVSFPAGRPGPSSSPLSTASVRGGEIVYLESLDKDYRPPVTWHDVTEEIESVRRKHGDDWVILGRSFHRLFEGLSNGTISPDSLEAKIPDILRMETISDRSIEAMKKVINDDIRRLEERGLLKEIILPVEGSYAELPFVLQKGSRIYRGRIDRVIMKNGAAAIYDYKTYPVPEDEIPLLVERYSFQMDIYREAVKRLFSVDTETYLFFTHELKLVSV